jgi:hypothetical protein
MEDKSKAKAHMLKELSKEMSNDSNQGLKDILGKKNGMKKVTVASDSEEGLQKGLSMAEKLMKLKEGKKESPMEEMSEESMEEDESPEGEMQEHVASLSDEEAMAMFEALKQRLG